MKKFFDLDKHFENDSLWSDCGSFKIKIKRDNNFLKRVHLEHMEITVNRIVNSAVCNESPCHYVDGSCFCKDGQNGDYCNNSKWYPFWSFWSLLLYYVF